MSVCVKIRYDHVENDRIQQKLRATFAAVYRWQVEAETKKKQNACQNSNVNRYSREEICMFRFEIDFLLRG
jgi:hypothetical protein